MTEPIISQRVADQVIQLKDGEPALLAGLMQVQDTKNVNGTPGLGEIPILKYFFASTDKTQTTDDVVFLIIPHIVRESILTDENTRAIYTGTSQSVELLRKAPTAPAVESTGMAPATNSLPVTSAANAAQAMIGKMAADSRPATEGMMAWRCMADGTMSPTPLTLTMMTPTQAQPVGSTFQVAITATNAHDLFAVPLQLQFDPKVLSLVNVDSGELLAKGGQDVVLVHRDEGDGAVTISATRPPGTKGVDGQGTVCTLTFKAIGPGDATLALARIGARDSQQGRIATVGVPGVVHVK